MITQPQPDSKQVKWEFALPSRLGVARYGTFQAHHYKQFLPAGHEIESIHPPKRIDPKLYRIASNQPGMTRITSG